MKTATYYTKTKKPVGHAGGYAIIPKGTRVKVMPARNQPNWQEKQLVFIESNKANAGPALLVSLSEGII